MDPWERQRQLARTTVAWSLGSVAVGLRFATRRDPWWRAFGQQHVGWGVVDLGVVAVVDRLQDWQMSRLPDPWAPDTLERRKLRTILAANAVADAAYVVVGAVLWRRRRRNPRAAGAGAGIVVQGAFLGLHDGYHALRARA